MSTEIENECCPEIEILEAPAIEFKNVNHVRRHWGQYQIPQIDNGFYKVNKTHVFRFEEVASKKEGDQALKCIEVCRTPFILCGVSTPTQNEGIFYKIRYATNTGEIKEFWATQGDLLSRKELKTLFLAKGINCPESRLLDETIDYISRFISEFGDKFKSEFSAQKCGWHNEKSLFVLGNRAITLQGVEPILITGTEKEITELNPKGTLQQWVNSFKKYFEFPLIRFKAYDAATAPLKALLGVESHITENFGATSGGKTLSAQLALSMFGNPEGLTIGAKSTGKGILLTMRDFADLPILIDEITDAGDEIQNVVYTITSNKGRVKSTVDGKRTGGEEYHATVMFTSERPLRDTLVNAGQQYRVNELSDCIPQLPAAEFIGIKTNLKEHYGHIGELYISEIFRLKESGELEKLYTECFGLLPATDSNIEGRSKAVFACVLTAGKILEMVFERIGMPAVDPVSIVNGYFTKCVQETPVELEHIRALRALYGLPDLHPGKFLYGDKCYNVGEADIKNEVYGFVDFEYINIYTPVFTKKMRDEGFSPSRIKSDLYKAGVTVSNDKKNIGDYVPPSKDSFKGRCIRIKKSEAEKILCKDVEAPKSKETFEPKNISYDEKCVNVLDTVKLLIKVSGTAGPFLLKTICNYVEFNDIVGSLLSQNKISVNEEGTYSPSN